MLTLYVDEITWDHDVDSCLTDLTMFDNIIHLSNTWEKVGIQLSKISAIYKLQENLGFS